MFSIHGSPGFPGIPAGIGAKNMGYAYFYSRFYYFFHTYLPWLLFQYQKTLNALKETSHLQHGVFN